MTAPKRRRFLKIKGRDYFGVFPEWLRPDEWGKVPFTHTITQTTCHGIPHFNPGTSLYLVEDRVPQPGEMFIWCQKSFDGFPTTPVWGRFMASTAKGGNSLRRNHLALALDRVEHRFQSGALRVQESSCWRKRKKSRRNKLHSLASF
jgi:hypothetical protein